MSETHPEYEQHGSFEHLKLGKLPPDPARKTLKFGEYINEAALPPIPSVFDLSYDVTKWPMYGNDDLGDCTCAAAGHMIQAWTAAKGAIQTPPTNLVEKTYWETGDPPSATGTAGGPTDTGRVEADVLSYWRKNGIGIHHHKITAYTQISPGSTAHAQAGAYLFGGLYLGIALPITAQQQSEWDYVANTPDNDPGSWGGHAVNVVGYDHDTVTIVTWGATLKMTWAFWQHYVDECWVLISPDWLSGGESPQGFNLAQLQSDLADL